MDRRCWITVFTVIIWLFGSISVAAEPLVAYTVNYPLQYFAQRIAGDHAEVVLPVPHDVDPAFWKPDAAAIGDIQRADLILLNGAGYAKWSSRVSLPRRKLVNTSAGFSDRYIRSQGGITHSHGRDGEHSHTGTAFTTWLDFSLAAEQAGAVHDALSRLMPQHGDLFTENYLALKRDLLDLDARLETLFSQVAGIPMIASHPVYQYLARRYSLNLKSVMWEPDAMPAETEWQGLAEMRKAHPASWMIWEGAPADDISRRLHQLGLQPVVYKPCANRPATGDFMSNMKLNLENIAKLTDQTDQ